MGCRAVGSDEPELDGTLVVAAIAGLMLQGLAADARDFEGAVLRPALERLFARIAAGEQAAGVGSADRGARRDRLPLRRARRRPGGPAGARLPVVVVHVAPPDRGAGRGGLARGGARPAGLRRLRARPARHVGAPHRGARAVPVGPGPGGRAAGGARLGRADRAALGLRPPGRRPRAGHLRHRLLPRRQVARHGQGAAHRGRGRAVHGQRQPRPAGHGAHADLARHDRRRRGRVLEVPVHARAPRRRAGAVPLGRLREARALRGQARRARRSHQAHLGRRATSSPPWPARTAWPPRSPAPRWS